MSERKTDIAYIQVRMPLDVHASFGDVASSHSHSIPEELLEMAKAWIRISERDRAAFFLKAAEATP